MTLRKLTLKIVGISSNNGAVERISTKVTIHTHAAYNSDPILIDAKKEALVSLLLLLLLRAQ